MKFLRHILFLVLTFHHQNFTRYHMRFVCHGHFIKKKKQLLTPPLQNHYMQQIESL